MTQRGIYQITFDVPAIGELFRRPIALLEMCSHSSKVCTFTLGREPRGSGGERHHSGSGLNVGDSLYSPLQKNKPDTVGLHTQQHYDMQSQQVDSQLLSGDGHEEGTDWQQIGMLSPVSCLKTHRDTVFRMPGRRACYP